MADNYKTIGDVTVTAEQFDPDNNQIPAACIPDGDWTRSHGVRSGYKVATDALVCFPMPGDWIVTKGGHSVIVSDALFQILFTAVV